MAPAEVPKAVVEAQELRIRDTYYEWDDELWRKGIWVRFRTHIPPQDSKLKLGDWNAKLRLEGDFTNSRMVEVHGESAVEDLLQRHAPGATLSNLTAYAKFVTDRRAWDIPVPFQTYEGYGDWRMQMVLDVTTTEDDDLLEAGALRFHHEVGEIELTKDIRSDNARASLDLEAKRTDSHLQSFVGKHVSLFDSGQLAVGKLEAYIRWKAAQATKRLAERRL